MGIKPLVTIIESGEFLKDNPFAARKGLLTLIRIKLLVFQILFLNFLSYLDT